MLIGEVFGTPNHKIVKSISSTGKSFFIDFKKQYPVGGVEFVAFIKYNKINPDCQSWLDNHMIMSMYHLSQIEPTCDILNSKYFFIITENWIQFCYWY